MSNSITFIHNHGKPFSAFAVVRDILKEAKGVKAKGTNQNVEINLKGFDEKQIVAVYALLTTLYLTVALERYVGLPVEFKRTLEQPVLSVIPEIGPFSSMYDRKANLMTISLPAYQDGSLPVHQMEMVSKTLFESLEAAAGHIQESGGTTYAPLFFGDIPAMRIGVRVMDALAKAHGNVSPGMAVCKDFKVGKRVCPTVLIPVEIYADIVQKEGLATGPERRPGR